MYMANEWGSVRKDVKLDGRSEREARRFGAVATPAAHAVGRMPVEGRAQ